MKHIVRIALICAPLTIFIGASIAQTPAPVAVDWWGTLSSAVITYGPWIVTTASTLAALIPATAVNASPILKVITALIDVLALNVNKAKEGPPPLAVFKEVATGEVAPERFDRKG